MLDVSFLTVKTDNEQKKEGEEIMKDNIILIGMPGVGKSTTGVILAKVENYDFLDSDLLIQKMTGKRLHELIRERGLDGFNSLENEINSGIDTHHTVIATGGSVVYGKEAMEHFQQIGTIIYLKISYHNLDQRLGNLDERGVVHREDQDLLDIYEERCPLYEKYADITVELDGKNISETVDAMIEQLDKF